MNRLLAVAALFLLAACEPVTAVTPTARLARGETLVVRNLADCPPKEFETGITCKDGTLTWYVGSDGHCRCECR